MAVMVDDRPGGARIGRLPYGLKPQSLMRVFSLVMGGDFSSGF